MNSASSAVPRCTPHLSFDPGSSSSLLRMGHSLGKLRKDMRIPTYALAKTTALRHQTAPRMRGENPIDGICLCPAKRSLRKQLTHGKGSAQFQIRNYIAQLGLRERRNTVSLNLDAFPLKDCQMRLFCDCCQQLSGS